MTFRRVLVLNWQVYTGCLANRSRIGGLGLRSLPTVVDTCVDALVFIGREVAILVTVSTSTATMVLAVGFVEGRRDSGRDRISFDFCATVLVNVRSRRTRALFGGHSDLRLPTEVKRDLDLDFVRLRSTAVRFLKRTCGQSSAIDTIGQSVNVLVVS
jgi:hypothetical protein